LKKHFDPREYYAPVLASFDIAIEDVECGEEHAGILTKDGELWMVGSNQSGQLGLKMLKGLGKADPATQSQTLASFDSFRTRKEDIPTANEEANCKSNKYFAPVQVHLPKPPEVFGLPQ
jgi:alpha-tubulin suppressor-like RCC1 family protein